MISSFELFLDALESSLLEIYDVTNWWDFKDLVVVHAGILECYRIKID